MMGTHPTQPDSPQHKRVVVAMSGGVDSSVAAALLIEQGFEVIGLMMRLWSEPTPNRQQSLNRCCTPDQMADARRVAQQLAIPFYVVDTQEYFHDAVVRYFIDEHSAGRTPNPCIECNRRVRFSYLLDRALAMGADYLATGHYARVQRDEEGYHLLKAIDPDKDQAYVLHVLGQSELSQVKFPIGDYTKHEVRQLADTFDLQVAHKSESMDLCFLADGDHRRFLREAAPEAFVRGPILDDAGQVLGQHNGLANYTIGQRKGLGIALGQPIYVVAKDSHNNALIVGGAQDLGQTVLHTERTNWVSGGPPAKPISAEVMIRYRAKPVPALITATGSSTADIEFERPVTGIAPGQGAVFFDGQVCLGGGIIWEENH